MRKFTDEEVELLTKLCDEADSLSDEEKEKMWKRLCEIDDEQTNGFTWTT